MRGGLRAQSRRWRGGFVGKTLVLRDFTDKGRFCRKSLAKVNVDAKVKGSAKPRPSSNGKGKVARSKRP